MRVAVLIIPLLGLVAVPALAQDQEAATPPAPVPVSALSALELHGYVDTYYGFNFNHPADGASFIPGTGTSAKRAGEVGLNLAAIDLSMKPEPVGFRLILNYGTSAEVVHAGEPSGVVVGVDVWRFIQQASVIWQATSKLQLEAGIYPSHIGFEVLPSKDNWTYTRSWMAEFSPFYQTGAKATYAFSEHFSAQVHFLNGWQIIGDNNRAKSVGTQVAWNSEVFSLAFNTFAGPELAGDNEHWRLFGDLVAVVHPTARLSAAASVDVGYQQRPALDAAVWQAAGLSVRYALTDAFAIAGRGEVFSDPKAGITGSEQTLTEGTLCLELKPAPALTLKLEGRYDHSTAKVFSSRELDGAGAPVPVPEQALVVFGAVASF